MTAAPTKIWQGIEASHPPCLRHDHRELRAMAHRLLESRRQRFPDMIARNALSADEAASQLAVFEQIAADWQWICTGRGEPAPYATIQARRDALDGSLRTIAAVASERGGFDAQLHHQAHCLIALRWHLEPGVELHTRVIARANHDQRRAHASREKAHA